jgi:hypothetical protein
MREESHSQVTKLLSPRLAEDAAWHVHRNWLVTLPLMGEVNKAFLSRVALKMEHTVYAPRERPPLGSLYCIFQVSTRLGLTWLDLTRPGRLYCILQVRARLAFTSTLILTSSLKPSC